MQKKNFKDSLENRSDNLLRFYSIKPIWKLFCCHLHTCLHSQCYAMSSKNKERASLTIYCCSDRFGIPRVAWWSRRPRLGLRQCSIFRLSFSLVLALKDFPHPYSIQLKMFATEFAPLALEPLLLLPSLTIL